MGEGRNQILGSIEKIIILEIVRKSRKLKQMDTAKKQKLLIL